VALPLPSRFWRALGFLDVGEEEKGLSPNSTFEAIELFLGMVRIGATEVDTALQLARVIGSSMARIAEAEVVPGTMTVGIGDDNVLVADAFASVADTTVPAMAKLLEFVWRRHVQAATRRTMLLRTHGQITRGESGARGRLCRTWWGSPPLPAPGRGRLAAGGTTVRRDLSRHRDRVSVAEWSR